MLDDRADDTWPVVASDLRGTLLRSGVSEAVVERVFAAVAPAVVAIERERGVVEDELLWALVAVAADSFQHARPDHLISGHIRRTQKDLQNTFGRKKAIG